MIMEKRDGVSENKKGQLTIDYKALGTISDRELIQALADDILVLEETFGVRFYSNAMLILWGSNEYGDPRYFKREGGGQIKRLDTCHYRPACLDYDL